MKISEMWKSQMKDILVTYYGDKLDEKKIDNYLQKYIDKEEKSFPTIKLRNLYTIENFEVPLDDLPNIIKNNDLCIGANGTLTYSYKKVETPIPSLLIKLKSDRKKYKSKELEYEEAIAIDEKNGIKDDNKKLLRKYYNNLQTKVKQDMNSFYGVQALKGSFVYNPDTAGMITAQARQLISEMMWSIEHMMKGNIQFGSIDEYINYFNIILKSEYHDTSIYDKYIVYVPNDEEIKNHIIKHIVKVPEYYKEKTKIILSLYHFISNLTDRQKIYIYYKNNIKELLKKNPLIFKIINDIMISKTKYINPNAVPDEFKSDLDLLCNILEEFCFTHMTTKDRVEKYQTRKRKMTLLSDTDSIIINLDSWVELCNSLTTEKFDAFDDEDMDFKVVNIAAFICTYITKVVSKTYCKYCNIPEDLWHFVEMKNEFLFKRIIIYKITKKNYAAHTRLREGKYVDKISYTGIKFVGTATNDDIRNKTYELVENKILRSKHINVIDIMNEIKSIELYIKQEIKNGNKTFGRKVRYSGVDGYKTGVYQNAAGRSCLIWNMLNPDNTINKDEYGYLFKTRIYTKEDCALIENEKIRKEIEEKVFDDDNFRRYGLSMISIPWDNGSCDKIPDWIIPLIDVDDLCEKQLQSITSLLPSVGIYNTRVSSTRNKMSSLISF